MGWAYICVSVALTQDPGVTCWYGRDYCDVTSRVEIQSGMCGPADPVCEDGAQWTLRWDGAGYVWGASYGTPLRDGGPGMLRPRQALYHHLPEPYPP